MSNGTRKKVVDFKKLLVNQEDNMHIRKKGFKINYSNQNNSHKKEKTLKNNQKQRENQSKAPEKPFSKRQKTRNCQKKEQLSLLEFTNKLNDYQEELTFLNKKRNADLNIEKILSFQRNNQNKINSALNNIDNKNKNNSKNKKSENIKDINNNNNNINNNNKNIINIEINKNNTKTEISSENSTLIIDFYKLYYHLFESNRLDNSKPYKFVDYLITGDNLLFNLKKDKSRFEEIKKGISLKTKNNSLINEQLLNKSIYEYLRCDFSNSFMKKLTEKINMFLMNRYINKKKEKNSAENSISIEKKDKFTYSNFLADKLKDNINKSCLSFTNDTEYFKSLIYVCNKYSKYIGKKEMPEKILIESLEKNKKILENFKNMDESGDTARKIEISYLNDLLHNKSIRKYISKKLKSLNDGILGNNQILNTLDINTFYKILSSLIKNKNDDDVDKLYKLFEEEIIVNDSNNLDKNDLKNFVILLRFLFELELTNKLNNNEIANNLNENNINNISLIKEIYENINIQLNNKQNENELDDKTLSNSNKKNKVRNRIKIKTKKCIKNIETSQNDSSKIDISDTNEDNINKSNININSQNQSFVSNISDKNSVNSSNTIIVKPKKRNKNSKIIPFKIPYPINNTNNNITTNNKTNNSLFEINNINDISNNISMPNNPLNKMEEQNKNNLVEKAYFEIYNEKQNENNDNNIKDKDKEKIKNKKGRKKNIEENKENLNNSINNVSDNKINDTADNKLLNKYVTFYSMNHSTLKELNLGKYILNKLSLGQDIFKLIIEKPKIKRTKEKENSENSLDKENENEENQDNKDNNKDNDKDKDNNKDNNKDKDNKDNNQNTDINNQENKKRSKKIKKEKIKEENNKIKEEKNKIKEEEKELKIKNEKDMRIKKEKDEDIIIRNDKNEEMKIKEEQDKIENKINNIKKEVETRDDSSKSNDKNDKINNFINIKKINNNIFLTKNEKNRNIDIIHFNNGMIQEGEPIKEITRNDLKHSPNISVKISQKTIKFPTYKTIDIDNSNTKYLFSTNKNNYNNLETKAKIRKNKNDINKKDSFKNINIQIDRQSVEIKGGNVILNDNRDNQNEDIIKIKDYFNAI